MNKPSLRLRFPHPMVLLLCGVLIASLLTWVLPAGAYERRVDPDSSGELVVPGTYTRVEGAPVGVAAAILAVPRGIVLGADVIVVILFVGGAYAMLDRTGALSRLIAALIGRTRRPRGVVVLVSLSFAVLGAMVNTHEGIIPTNGALLAMLLAAGVPYGRWLRFAVPGTLLVVLVGVVGTAFAR